jgi:predicted RNA-binding Zn-ribbon protein involved in translation (DUF1610 family)
MPNDQNIKMEKKTSKPKIIDQQPIVYSFTCKKCGSNSYRNVALHTHKFGGSGLGNQRVRVCTNCGWGDQITDGNSSNIKKTGNR